MGQVQMPTWTNHSWVMQNDYRQKLFTFSLMFLQFNFYPSSFFLFISIVVMYAQDDKPNQACVTNILRTILYYEYVCTCFYMLVAPQYPFLVFQPRSIIITTCIYAYRPGDFFLTFFSITCNSKPLRFSYMNVLSTNKKGILVVERELDVYWIMC